MKPSPSSSILLKVARSVFLHHMQRHAEQATDFFQLKLAGFQELAVLGIQCHRFPVQPHFQNHRTMRISQPDMPFLKILFDTRISLIRKLSIRDATHRMSLHRCQTWHRAPRLPLPVKWPHAHTQWDSAQPWSPSSVRVRTCQISS